MCVIFSGWVNEQCDIYRSDYTDSHNDLAELYDIRDTADGRIVPFECYPADEKSYDDLSKYILRCDCDEPEWWNGVKPKLIEKMKIIIEPKIIRNHRKILVGGQWILADGAHVDRVVNARIVVMLGSSSVGVMQDSSTVGVMQESSRVGVMWGSSSVGVMQESSRVGVMWGSSSVGTMQESSSVGEMWGSSRIVNDQRSK